MATPSPGPSPAAPSYAVLHHFLWSLAEWFADVQERLVCRNEGIAHAISADALARHHDRAYGWLSLRVGGWWQRSTSVAADAAEGALPRVALQLTAVVLLRGGLLLLVWWVLPRIVWAHMLPRLRARHITRQLRHLLSAHDHIAREMADVLLRPDAAQRRVNANVLWTVWACGVVGCVLILGLLSMHVWVDVVLWKVVLQWAAPVRQAWAWARSLTPLPLSETGTGPHDGQSASTVWLDAIARRLTPLRQVAEQAKLFYLWSIVGGTALGAALWLLRHATGLLATYNASVPFFSDSDPALRRLAQQDAEEAQRRTEAALHAVLLHQHTQAATLEGLARALEAGPPPSLVARLSDRQPAPAADHTEVLTGASAAVPHGGADDAAYTREDEGGAAAAEQTGTNPAASLPDLLPSAVDSVPDSSDGDEAWAKMEEGNADREAARASNCAGAVSAPAAAANADADAACAVSGLKR